MNEVNNQLEILSTPTHTPQIKNNDGQIGRQKERRKEKYLICKGFELDLGSNLYICLWGIYPWTSHISYLLSVCHIYCPLLSEDKPYPTEG